MSTTLLFNLPSDFNYTISGVCIAASILHFTGLLLAQTRAQIFSRETTAKVQSEIQLKNPSTLDRIEVPTQGYPDEGNGRFSKALGYYYWVKLNKAVRGFLNYNEQLMAFVIALFVYGLWHPYVAFWFGVVVAISRLVYFIGYAYLGPIVMMIGEIPALLIMFYCYGALIYHLIKGD